MKPCSNRQKHIAWLAMNALDIHEARDLRAHLATCPGCRAYLAEMSQVTAQLASATPKAELPASELFHRSVMSRIHAAASPSLTDRLGASLRPIIFNWRLALPVAALLLALLTLWTTPARHAKIVVMPSLYIDPPGAATTEKDADLAPSIANYQRVASESLDKLDDLLGQQERRMTESAPVYRASASSLSF